MPLANPRHLAREDWGADSVAVSVRHHGASPWHPLLRVRWYEQTNLLQPKTDRQLFSLEECSNPWKHQGFSVDFLAVAQFGV